MNTKILEQLRKEFAFVGDEKISGKTAMKIIEDTIEALTIPKHIENSQKFLQECGRDMAFEQINRPKNVNFDRTTTEEHEKRKHEMANDISDKPKS